MTETVEVPRGPYQGRSIIGEITEGAHRFLMEGWNLDGPPPRIEEDLSFVPKDREEVIYVYMYRLAHNSALNNPKRWRAAKFQVAQEDGSTGHFFERPPIYLDLFYVIGVHSKFRSDAERLLGWTILRLNEATHLVYRPRKYTLPNGDEVDSTGEAWSIDATGDDVIMEKVSLAMVDDLTVGDAINFFTIHEAPYRPYVTYRARCAMEGALIHGAPTIVRSLPIDPMARNLPPGQRPSGRIGRTPLKRTQQQTPIGPPGTDHRPITPEEKEE